MEKQNSGTKLFTPVFTCALLSQSFQVIASFVLVISLPMFLVAQGYSAFMVGVLASIMTISTVVARIIGGRLADLYGRKLIFLISMVLAFAVTVSYYFFAEVIELLIILRILQGISSGMSTGNGTTISLEVLP